jgi:hypothetical protein
MSKKWYSYFVSVDDGSSASQGGLPDQDAPVKPVNAAQSVAEIAQTVAPTPKFTSTVSDPT